MCWFGVFHYSSDFLFFFNILVFLPIHLSSFFNTFQWNYIVTVILPLFQWQYVFANMLSIRVELFPIHEGAQYSTAAPFFPLWNPLIWRQKLVFFLSNGTKKKIKNVSFNSRTSKISICFWKELRLSRDKDWYGGGGMCVCVYTYRYIRGYLAYVS